eukprot:3414412-Amphidinium_carterae.1
MDDYCGTCPESSLEWMERVLSEDIKLKRFVRHGIETRYSHLKRERVRTANGTACAYIPTRKTCSPVTTPVLPKGQDKEEKEDNDELEKEEKTLFQRCVGILAYLSQERPDIRPTKKHMKQLRRMARYLRGIVDYCLEIKRSDIGDKLNVFGDADWAGDHSRRSLSAGRRHCDQVADSAPHRFYCGLRASQTRRSRKNETYGSKTPLASRWSEGEAVQHTQDIGTKALVHAIMAKHMNQLGFRGVLLEKARAQTREGVVAYVSSTRDSVKRTLMAAIFASSAATVASAQGLPEGALTHTSALSSSAVERSSLFVVLLVLLSLVIALAIQFLLYSLRSSKESRYVEGEAQTDHIECEVIHRRRMTELRVMCEERRIRHHGNLKDELVRKLMEHQFQGRSS